MALGWDAGVGGETGEGRYALLRAVALKTYNPRRTFPWLSRRFKRIKSQHAYYGHPRDRLELRWANGEESYRLQLRSRCDYEDGINVRYYITKLWFDEHMNHCDTSSQSGEGKE